MRIKIFWITSLVASSLITTSIGVHAKQWITGLNAVQGGSCSSFGNGWEDFAYDGKSNIRFCKQITKMKPSIGVIEAQGIHPGNIDCRSKLGVGWENFAYDGKANISFCMMRGDIDSSENYIADINAFEGDAACDGVFAGRGWDRIIYNGYSGITYCARYK